MSNLDHTLLEELDRFLHDYYKQDIGEFVRHYPTERQSLYIEYADLEQWNADFADDVLNKHDQAIDYLEEALAQYDIPVDVDLSGATVRITDSEKRIPRLGVGELNESHLGEFVALRCQLGKVSERKPRLKEGAFMCQRCGTVTRIKQQFSESQEPHECQGCDRAGPFDLREQDSEWVDQRKVKLEAPPEATSGDELVGYCIGEMADPYGVNIQEKAGARVTVLGKLESDMSSLFGRGSNEPVADEYFVPHSFVWGDNLTNEIDVADHLDEVKAVASQPDAIDVFKRNIDPSLVVTDGWEQALEMATVWLFAAPRIDPEHGDTIRGDVHMLFVSDPGMNKSDFAQKLAELSPKALMKDSEGMSSEVALTAAATQGGFGDDSWSIEPGALPKANNGHLILDEIDKGPDGFLEGIHSPLEGEQMLRVEKAGQEANLATRCGFLALGNPVDGRFDPFEPIAEQVDLHPALMSRFDLICTMQDEPDEETDEEIASGVLESIDESARLDHGALTAEEAERVTGDVSRAVMKAWVKHARRDVQPLLSESAKTVLQEYYIDTRQMNGEESETPPATARTLVAGVRIAMAFARCELSETVEERHAERAVELSKTIVGKNFDPDTGEFDADRTTEAPSSQQERVEAILWAIDDESKTPEEIADELNLSEGTVAHRLEKLHQQNRVYQPATGEYQKA